MKYTIKAWLLGIVLLAFGMQLHALPKATNVSFTTRNPWNGKVDISFTVEGDAADGRRFMATFVGHDGDRDETFPLCSVKGAPSGGFWIGERYTVTWDAAADRPNFSSSSFKVKVVLHDNTYLVIDLSGGPDAVNYPWRYSSEGPDLSSDTCRTTELWLRRIPAGTFTMGSPKNELGRWGNETQHQVTLTQGFWIGVFEVTQRQYELIFDDNPSYCKGEVRPVEQVSYDDIRGTNLGAGWPSGGHVVDGGSFLGKLRAKTGLDFDLPTEAQWEYACRAGTTTALNSGKNLTATGECPNMAEVGRYWYNRSDGRGGYGEHTKVGCYLPNAWGLYDMHGNVQEWCLDWRGDYPSEAVTDPRGAEAGSLRVLRGGDWDFYAQYCRSAHRDIHYPSSRDNYYGFRLVCPP